MKISRLNEAMLTPQLIDKLLFGGFDYTGASADLIMVLGSRKACEYRVPVAAELFHADKAERLLFCGGKAQQTKYGFMPEFESMLIAADELQIPRDKIMTEERSATTAENYEFSQEIIAEHIPECRKIILVTTAYHMRRAYLLAKRLMPQYEFIACPANDGSTRRETWRLTEKGTRTAYDEAMKLKFYAENGFIDDIEI